MDALEKRLQELGKGRKEASAPQPKPEQDTKSTRRAHSPNEPVQKPGKEPEEEKKPKKEKRKKDKARKDIKQKARKDAKSTRRAHGTNVQKPHGVMWELLMIGVKIAGILLVVVLIFTFVFGIARTRDISMFPNVKDGDLVIYYRLDKDYVKTDTIAVKYNGDVQTRRVMAIAGDTVDINENGLYINGSLQAEEDIHEETLPYNTGVRFPLTVGKDEVFVLGDGRENATDSRVYGCVNVKDSMGKVMMIIRTRGI